ncbi:MAG: hypothetical protein HY293_19875, partial [Planctomycetes bacterium]|nr:hypothetical protein [Planctomycetota bacterium]
AREAKPELDRAAAEYNLLILSREAARLKGDNALWMERTKSIPLVRQRLHQISAGETIIPELLEISDEVLGIEDANFATLKPADASRRISESIARIPAGTFIKVRVRRGNERDVLLYFGSASGTGVALTRSGYVRIANAFAIEVQKNILSLPPGQLTDFDRANIERILGAGEATEEEYAMLRSRLSGVAVDSAAAGSLRESFARQIERLNAMLPKAPVPEAIIMKDGRRFSGKLLQDTPAAVSVRTVVGDITVAKDDVERLVTADDLRAEFMSKFKAGEKYRDALLQLLVWTQEMNLPVHRELVAYTILQTAPSEPFARNAAGYFQMDGQWTLKNSIAAGAPIPERKAETKDEIRRELESMGFVLRKDHWFVKVPWSTGIESLYRPGSLKVGMNGTSIMDWHEADTPIYRTDDKPKKLGPLDLKFIAPTGAQGLASVLVEAPGEIVECQVRATGFIIEDKVGARIECFLTAEGGRSEVLYDISKKADSAFHDVTMYTRGKSKFTVTARMMTVQDKYQTYARFLPPNKDTTQVFWVKGIVLRSAAEFDRLWSAAH